MMSDEGSGFSKTALAGVLIIGLLIGGGVGFGVTYLTTPVPQQDQYTVTIDIAGSDTLLELARAWADNYTIQNPSVTINVAGGGSGTGIAALINGQIDIADASREAKASEISDAASVGVVLTKHVMVIDGIAIIVHNTNALNNITFGALRGIYNGTITTWDQVNSSLPANTIVAYGRQSTSGTYAYFQEDVMENDDYAVSVIQLAGNSDIINNVKDDSNGIGYVGAAYAEAAASDVKILSVAETILDTPVAPTPENIEDFSYPISRFLYCYTDGSPTGFIQAYIAWCQSPQGQEVAQVAGYVPAYPIY